MSRGDARHVAEAAARSSYGRLLSLLARTTRDEPDYDKLMTYRLNILHSAISASRFGSRSRLRGRGKAIR